MRNGEPFRGARHSQRNCRGVYNNQPAQNGRPLFHNSRIFLRERRRRHVSYSCELKDATPRVELPEQNQMSRHTTTAKFAPANADSSDTCQTWLDFQVSMLWTDSASHPSAHPFSQRVLSILLSEDGPLETNFFLTTYIQARIWKSELPDLQRTFGDNLPNGGIYF
jgi:hypothetical protein